MKPHAEGKQPVGTAAHLHDRPLLHHNGIIPSPVGTWDSRPFFFIDKKAFQGFGQLVPCEGKDAIQKSHMYITAVSKDHQTP